MEISEFSPKGIKIKGKNAVIGINLSGKTDNFSANIISGENTKEGSLTEGMLTISGPGEYEVSGVKITGTRDKKEVYYKILIDGLEIVMGSLNSLSDSHQKLTSHDITLILADDSGDGSFISSLETRQVIIYGEAAGDVVKSTGKEEYEKLSKIQLTRDKLPGEMKIVILQ